MSAILPTDAKARKATPIFTGVLKYFPRALAHIAEISKAGNDQHNPGQPMHWAKHKSTDHGDCIVRHQLDAGTIDTDGKRHSGKVAWRALAQLEIELEAAELGISVEELIARYQEDAEQAAIGRDIDRARAYASVTRGPTVEETVAAQPICPDCNETKWPEHICPAKPIFKGNKESSRPIREKCFNCGSQTYTTERDVKNNKEITRCGNCGDTLAINHDPIFKRIDVA